MNKPLFILFVVFLAGCSDHNKEISQTQDGRQLYEMYCAACHKENGKGQFLLGIPKNKDTHLSVSEVASLIRRGHKDLENMPTFPQLTNNQAYSIASYLKHKLGAQ